MFLLSIAAMVANMPVAGTPHARCENADIARPASGAAAQPRRLDELPQADLYLTVFRKVDACPAPVIVRHDVGDAGKR